MTSACVGDGPRYISFGAGLQGLMMSPCVGEGPRYVSFGARLQGLMTSACVGVFVLFFLLGNNKKHTKKERLRRQAPARRGEPRERLRAVRGRSAGSRERRLRRGLSRG